MGSVSLRIPLPVFRTYNSKIFSVGPITVQAFYSANLSPPHVVHTVTVVIDRYIYIPENSRDADLCIHDHTFVCWIIKPQSHRIVRFLDRTISCDWAKVRPIGNVCYDLQQQTHTAIDLYTWSRYRERLENIDGKSNRGKSCD